MTRHEADLPAHEVAAWLRRTPDFLSRYPDVAEVLQPPRGNGQATSLASYQLEVLREKNRELGRRLHELHTTAEINERLAVRTQQLTLALMRQGGRAGTVRAMAASLSEDFAGDVVRVVLFAPEPALIGEAWFASWAPGSRELAPFQDCLNEGTPIAGRLNSDKQQVLYGAAQDAVQSTLLLPILSHGLVAVGSHDPNRFYPGMGMLFAQMMAEAFAVALERFAPAPTA